MFFSRLVKLQNFTKTCLCMPVYMHKKLFTKDNKHQYSKKRIETNILLSHTLSLYQYMASKARKGQVAILRLLWTASKHSPDVFLKLFDGK